MTGGQEFRGSRGLVLATGPGRRFPGRRAGRYPYWTNHEALEIKEAPASLTVAGGGAVGAELAQAFARFGTAVTIVEAADRLPPGEEPEAGELICEVFRREGIRVLTRTRLRAADGVWSVGDVTGAGAFTHVAMYQARIAARDILGQAHEPASYRALPRMTFTDPEVVALTEAQARGKGITMRTAVYPIPSSSRRWIHGLGNDGFIKLIADADAGMLIGATSAGPADGEVLGALAVAVHARVPVALLRQMIYACPAFHRAIEDAITQLCLLRPDRALAQLHGMLLRVAHAEPGRRARRHPDHRSGVGRQPA